MRFVLFEMDLVWPWMRDPSVYMPLINPLVNAPVSKTLIGVRGSDVPQEIVLWSKFFLRGGGAFRCTYWLVSTNKYTYFYTSWVIIQLSTSRFEAFNIVITLKLPYVFVAVKINYTNRFVFLRKHSFCSLLNDLYFICSWHWLNQTWFS